MPETSTPTVPRQSRTIGYHNAIEDHSIGAEDHGPPPTYSHACTPRKAPQLCHRSVSAPVCEALPHYACSLTEGSPVNIRYERTSPFTLLPSSQWADVFLVLQGTRLSIHQQTTPGLFSKAHKPIMAGKLLKTYSLQHAEVGVAADCKKYELVSRTPMTAFLPLAIQERMKETEPHLFEPIRQYIIRIRVECDQILIRVKSWEERMTWVEKLCAAVDIAPPIDERSEPKNHTLPRRRHRPIRNPTESARMRLNNLVESQQRIIRERFPHLLLPEVAEDPEHHGEQDQEAADIADPDADDLDTSVVRGEEQPGEEGDGQERDDTSRMMSRFSRFVQPPAPPHGRIFSAQERMFISQDHQNLRNIQNRPRLRPLASAPDVHPLQASPSDTAVSHPMQTSRDPYKPAETPQMDFTQEARYRRRCMPTLLLNSRRATDIVVQNGSCYKLDWTTSSMKPHPELPPSYAPAPLVTLEPAEDADAISTVPSLTPDRPPLRNSRSATTVNESAGSSVEEGTSPGTRRKLKDAVGTWGRRMRNRQRDSSDASATASGQAEMTVMEEKFEETGSEQRRLRIDA